MMGLTKRQSELLKFLRAHFAAHISCPSLHEISQVMGWSGKAIAHHTIKALIARGYLRKRLDGRRFELVESVNHGTRDCFCEGCNRVRIRAAQICIQALHQPAPNLPFVGLRPLGHLDRLNWSRFDHNDRSKSSFRRAKPSQTSLDQIPGRAV